VTTIDETATYTQLLVAGRTAMLLITLGIIFLFGAVLSLRFSSIILFPSTVVAILAVAGTGTAQGDHIATVVLTIALVAVALQIGYLFGLVARAGIASWCTRSLGGQIAPSVA
jgi:hypothetical protein